MPVVARSRGKRKQDFYDEETGGGGSGDRSVGRVSSALVGEDVVEHDYGDCGQAEVGLCFFRCLRLTGPPPRLQLGSASHLTSAVIDTILFVSRSLFNGYP